MLRIASRALGLALSAGVVIGLGSVPAGAGSAVSVTLTPGYGPVGTTVDIHAASGLTHVTGATFAGGVAAARTDAAGATTLDTDVHLVVPTGASTGVLTLHYDNAPDAATNTPFGVQQPTHIAVSVNPGVEHFPHGTRLTAVMTVSGSNVAVSGQRLRLQRALPHTSGWHNVQPAHTTNSAGSTHWRLQSSRTWAYRVVFTADPSYLSSVSNRRLVVLRPAVVIHVPTLIPTLTTTDVPGRVRPAQRHTRVRLQALRAGKWSTIDHARTVAHGRFTFHVSFPTTGRVALRVARPGNQLTGSWHSHIGRARIVPRSLTSGDTGADVRALQRRLKHLHYDLGAASGTFDYDTLHAVIAFQKVQGMPRDGIVGLKVFAALSHPKVPHLRHRGDAASAGVEVDLAHQVVYYAVGSKITRILDSSTGGGYYYTGSDGTQQKAVTPTGHFSIQYKINKWVTSKLGTLYRPAYFNNQGYAIHGEGDVPSYPASHGCVRITVPAMDRMYDKLYDGMSVWIY